MDIERLKNSAAGFLVALLTMVSTANAAIIHNFTFDDISEWGQVNNFFDGDSLSVTFDVGTDFNNVQWDDILAFQFNLAMGTTYLIDSQFETRGVASGMFSESNGAVSMTFSVSGPYQYLYGFSSVLNTFGQFGTGGGTPTLYGTYHLVPDGTNDATYSDGTPINYQSSITLNGQLDDVVYTSSVSVSEPTTLAIFALGFAGLATRRVKVSK
jgi:hypothetical protein